MTTTLLSRIVFIRHHLVFTLMKVHNNYINRYVIITMNVRPVNVKAALSTVVRSNRSINDFPLFHRACFMSAVSAVLACSSLVNVI